MIRLFSTETGEYFKELRRGGEKAQIYSISFSPNSKYLACSSDRGTVHIFSLYNVIEKLKAHKEE
jgi:WD40 repeat protein